MNNTFITGPNARGVNGGHFVLTPSDTNDLVDVSGNIETLLDYATVAIGGHPQVGSYCFTDLFGYNDYLASTPAIRIVDTSEKCLQGIFRSCPNLETIPALYIQSFTDCCCYNMFQNCSKIKMSTTYDSVEYVNEYDIPVSGEATSEGMQPTGNMFYNTGGTFQSEPGINTVLYTANRIIY